MIEQVMVRLKSGVNINYKNVFQLEKVFDKDLQQDLLCIAGKVRNDVCFDKYPVVQVKGIDFK